VGHEQPLLEWGVAGRALPGQLESGDRHLVELFPGGALVAVVDGLGHGEEAAAASRTAVIILQKNVQESIIALVQLCHEGLIRTRGVAMSLASFRTDRNMTWLGVGNVQGRLVRANRKPSYEDLLMRGGVVGYRLPPLRAALLPVERNDVLILATDGIRENFAETLPLTGSPQGTAESILARSGKFTDDALVLVARYLGGAP
jgi:serine/threonine protein phosphatase PrpC